MYTYEIAEQLNQCELSDLLHYCAMRLQEGAVACEDSQDFDSAARYKELSEETFAIADNLP